MSEVRPCRVVDESGSVKAAGAMLPSGVLVLEWKRDYFPPEQRTENRVESRYESVNDVELGAGGSLEFED